MYENRLDDIFEIQDEIARRVVEALKVRLVPTDTESLKPTISVEAYNLYLKGRHYWHRRNAIDLERARDCFAQALEIDPQFAVAYAGLADAYSLLYEYGALSNEEAVRLSEQAAERALEIEPDLAEAHAALGLIMSHKRCFPSAEKALREAIRLNPNYAMAHMWLANSLVDQGRFLDADEEYQAAHRLDPLSPIVTVNIAHNYFHLGRQEEARDKIRSVLEITPDFAGTYRNIALFERLTGRMENVLDYYRRAQELDPGTWILPASLALLYLELEDLENAERWIEHALTIAPDHAWVIARRRWIFMARGDIDGYYNYCQDRYKALPERTAVIAAMGFAEMIKGNLNEARRLLESADPEPATPHGPLLNATDLSWGYLYAIDLARIYLASGEKERANVLLDSCFDFLQGMWDQGFREPVGFYIAAVIRTQQDRADEALDYLGQAMQKGWRHHWWMESDPGLESLRNRPEYKKLCDEMEQKVTDLRGRLHAENDAPQ